MSIEQVTKFRLIKNKIFYLILILIIFVGFSYSGDSTKFNFTYSEGDKPWLNHINTEINTTYEDVFTKLRNYVCSCDSIDNKNNPFKKTKSVCLEGEGAKMVIPQGHPDWSHMIFISPQDGGLLEMKHMTKNFPTHFYDNSKYQTKYFLIPFDDYEIPTYYPVITKTFLPIWKRVFQKTNEMNDEYFKKHIRVISASLRYIDFMGEQEQHFIVEYYYYIDWVQIKLFDSFKLFLEDSGQFEVFDSVSYADSLKALKEKLYSKKNSRTRQIKKFVLINNIVSKSEITEAVSKASPLFRFNVNRRLYINYNGQLALDVYGTIDDEANKCLKATVLLKDASVFNIKETPCRIY